MRTLRIYSLNFHVYNTTFLMLYIISLVFSYLLFIYFFIGRDKINFFY